MVSDQRAAFVQNLTEFLVQAYLNPIDLSIEPLLHIAIYFNSISKVLPKLLQDWRSWTGMIWFKFLVLKILTPISTFNILMCDEKVMKEFRYILRRAWSVGAMFSKRKPFMSLWKYHCVYMNEDSKCSLSKLNILFFKILVTLP